MPGGRLNKRASFYQKSETPDGAGGVSEVWTLQHVVACQFIPERAREQIATGRMEGMATGVIKCRSSIAMRTVDETWIASVDDIYYNIRGATNPDQRNRFLEFLVQSTADEIVVNQGAA